MKFHLLSLACAASLALPAAAQTVIHDSYGPGGATDGWASGVYNTGAGRMDLAIPFTLASATSIETITSSLDGVGGVTFGVLARSGAVPSGSAWLYSTHLVDPWANTELALSGWALPAGNYWLAAVADAGFDGTWQSGTSNYTADWAFAADGVWQAATNQLEGMPAARIAITSAVPEPGSYALMLAGGLLLAAALRRKGGAA